MEFLVAFDLALSDWLANLNGLHSKLLWRLQPQLSIPGKKQ
jgi:hypothetical protein